MLQSYKKIKYQHTKNQKKQEKAQYQIKSYYYQMDNRYLNIVLKMDWIFRVYIIQLMHMEKQWKKQLNDFLEKMDKKFHQIGYMKSMEYY